MVAQFHSPKMQICNLLDICKKVMMIKTKGSRHKLEASGNSSNYYIRKKRFSIQRNQHIEKQYFRDY